MFLTRTVLLMLVLLFANAPLWAQSAPQQDPAAGYLMVTGWYKDLGLARAYTEAMTEVIHKHGYQGGAIGMPGKNLRVLEGNWAPRLMILAKFPSEENVKQFWWSDEYQEVAKIRLPVSILDVIQLDGLPGVDSTMDKGSAYLVFFAHLTDRKKFMEEYAPYAPAVVDQHQGKFLIMSRRADIELLEGEFPNVSVVVLEFPGEDALDAFWSSDEYKRLSEIRKATGEWTVIEIRPVKVPAA